MNQFGNNHQSQGGLPRHLQAGVPQGHIHGQKRKRTMTASNLSLIIGIVFLLGIIILLATLIW